MASRYDIICEMTYICGISKLKQPIQLSTGSAIFGGVILFSVIGLHLSARPRMLLRVACRPSWLCIIFLLLCIDLLSRLLHITHFLGAQTRCVHPWTSLY